MAIPLDNSQSLINFPEKTIKANERNFEKYKILGETVSVVLFGQPGTERGPVRPVFAVEEDEENSKHIGALVRANAPPTRHNIRNLETLTSDRLIQRNEDAKPINTTLECLEKPGDWASAYEIWDEATVKKEWEGSTNEASRLHCLTTRLYLGHGKYLGPPLATEESFKETEFTVLLEEKDTTKNNSENVEYYKEKFETVKFEALSQEQKKSLGGKSFGAVLVAVLFEAGRFFADVPAKCYIEKIKQIEKRPAAVNAKDNLCGGANHLNKVFTSSMSKIQQRSNPKKSDTSDGLLSSSIQAGIISNKKASNAANAASSESPTQTMSSVKRLLDSFNRNVQAPGKENFATAILSRIVTSISTYETKAKIRESFMRRGHAIRNRISSEISTISLNNDLTEYVRVFTSWALNAGTASTDQILICPGDLSMFGMWIESQNTEEDPLVVRAARFENIALAVHGHIPATTLTWQSSEAESYMRAITIMNLYDAPSETIAHCFNNAVFEDSPRTQPFTSSTGLGILKAGSKARLAVDLHYRKPGPELVRVFTQKARTAEVAMVQAMSAYINPRGLDGKYIDTVKYLDMEKNESITFEEAAKEILESGRTDPVKVVRSQWFDVETGKGIPDGGPRKITNVMAIGPFRKVDLTFNGDPTKIEEVGQVLAAGITHSSKVMKRSYVPKSYRKEEFLEPHSRKRKWDFFTQSAEKRAAPLPTVDLPGENAMDTGVVTVQAEANDSAKKKKSKSTVQK